jgi:hypothetical protein
MSDLVLSPDMLVDALEMRKQGRSWRAIAAGLGVGEDWLRRRADPGYRTRANALWKARNRGPHFVPALDGLGSEPPQRVPLDTRTRFARAMGDPVPGRSALDQRRYSQAGLTTSGISARRNTFGVDRADSAISYPGRAK